jgi:hypothetical protein
MQQFTPIPEFDQLKEMAQKNPEQLEALRLQLIEETISLADERTQRKLRGLQFHIDMEVRRAKSPIAACVKISEMMHQSLNQLRSMLNNEVQETSSAVISSRVRDISVDDYPMETASLSPDSASTPTKKSAKILMFPII